MSEESAELERRGGTQSHGTPWTPETLLWCSVHKRDWQIGRLCKTLNSAFNQNYCETVIKGVSRLKEKKAKQLQGHQIVGCQRAVNGGARK